SAQLIAGETHESLTVSECMDPIGSTVASDQNPELESLSFIESRERAFDLVKLEHEKRGRFQPLEVGFELFDRRNHSSVGKALQVAARVFTHRTFANLSVKVLLMDTHQHLGELFITA